MSQSRGLRSCQKCQVLHIATVQQQSGLVRLRGPAAYEAAAQQVSFILCTSIPHPHPIPSCLPHTLHRTRPSPARPPAP